MNSLLATKLIIKGVIREKTIIEANYSVVGLSGILTTNTVRIFTILTASKNKIDETIVFTVRSHDGLPNSKILCEDVVSVDGMSIKRLAEIYHLNLNGDDRVIRNQRGRKRGVTYPILSVE